MSSATDTQPEVTKRASAPLYAKHAKIYPKKVTGPFRRLKWAVLVALLGIYYILPWIRWDRGPNAPDQAVLLDLEGRRFYLFFIELWPQQIYYLTGALILASVGLFLATSLAGRVWCGYACPQTVWTDLYVWVERLFEGERGDRIRMDQGKWTLNKLWRKAAKNAAWILIAFATGGAWIFYFTDAPTLAWDLVTLNASSTAVWFILLFTGTTYLLAGFAREQVCIYMCPWPRFQSAMTDEDSLVVTYREYRGEGRAHLRKTQSWEERKADGHGDCIDCNACYHACPTGVDIREGSQLACIGCGLCIDACDEIMTKIGRPKGLIAFDTQNNLVSMATTGKKAVYKLVRPRTIIYSLLMVVVSGMIAAGLVLKPSLDISVLRDRAPLFVALADGSVRNAYTFKISNMTRDSRDYTLTASGLAGIELSVAGEHQSDSAARLRLSAAPDQVATYRIFVTVPRASVTAASVPLTLTLTTAGGDGDSYKTVFMGPAN
ncbi:cytochrome c oxidase accessory protein CcoG [Azospirillum sp. RWY-5-1]|uniref:Cytochrome c oxidase accessory protein CcoG n=1 Tax=Azospirillum oleiclasticum TaxID=2735135 RepID=A0ABX2T768_9PROT|nr:cytochrome c oxidase accessory protein CcoG [Azospirillum oleiclasticum]NYZ13186.1 cytochrome c oxidase accessory protein CcoG [Azospirillum oleiclasticum]NYZ20141.1 cytochrome c oxidase accessory protein CcoG [Azospirillum oleiclasticum]